MRDTKIIAAFPACGKSFCFERNDNYTILDIDSSKFSWMHRKRTAEELATINVQNSVIVISFKAK